LASVLASRSTKLFEDGPSTTAISYGDVGTGYRYTDAVAIDANQTTTWQSWSNGMEWAGANKKLPILNFFEWFSELRHK